MREELKGVKLLLNIDIILSVDDTLSLVSLAVYRTVM